MFRQFRLLAPHSAFALSLPLALGACGELERAETARLREGIVGGELSPTGIEDAVLILRATVPGVGERLCGASLVAENLVVTARHCVAYVTEGPFRCETSGERTEGIPGAGRMGLDLAPESIELFANDVPRTDPIAIGSEVVSTLSDSACTNDLAFVVLDRSLPFPVLPLRRGRPALVGEAVIVVGYGAERSGLQAVDFATQKRRRKSDLAIAGVGPDSANPLATVPPRSVVIEGPSACLGDSGGPLLAEATNALLAVHSLIEGDCVAPETRSFFTHVPPLWPWVERAFEAAGATPTLEPEPPLPCSDAGECAGAGGESAGGAPGSSDAGDGSGGSSRTGGSGGMAGDPTEPEPPPRRASKSTRDSGCSVSSGLPSSHAASAAALLLALLARCGRRAVSAGRREDRRPAADSAA
ncbi:MAG TPA: trypsin-like serine protease [Polyangiaceae bacterium]|nr:trypsin-like serine protease [Polyangiaceae bacterium]